MSVLAWSAALLATAFAIHLGLWRLKLPKRQTRALLIIFFGSLATGLILSEAATGTLSAMGVQQRLSFAEQLHIVICVGSFALAYIATYSALEVDSPTLVIVMTIANSGESGISREEFYASMTDDTLVAPRVRDLLRDGMAYVRNGRYYPTDKGVRLLKAITLHRKLMGLQVKGG